MSNIQHRRSGFSRVGPKINLLVWILTFGVFMMTLTLTSRLSFVVAGVLALNFALMMFSLCFLYRHRLLLSPPAIFLVTCIPFYTFGNIGDLTGRESWILSHQGALENYSIVAILSSIGLIVYLWSLARFNKINRVTGVRGEILQDSLEVPELLRRCVSFKSIVCTSTTAILLLSYLSWYYSFVGGYFIDVNSQFDKYLAGTMYSFIFLAALLSIAGICRGKGPLRLLSIIVVGMSLVLVVMMRSRSTMGFLVVCMLGVAFTVLPLSMKYLNRIVVTGVVLLVVLLGVGTVVKDAQRAIGLQEASSSLMGNLGSVVTVSTQDAARLFISRVAVEGPSRMAGFEFPASLLMAFDNGGEPMYGKALVSAAIAFLPAMLRPEGIYSERHAIGEFYRPYGFIYNDMPGMVLSTGLAEAGIWGVIPVFMLFAYWHSLLWRLVCRSQLLFLAYLAHIPALIRMDLLWDSIFLSLRVGVVMIIALYCLAPLMRRFAKKQRRVRPFNSPIRSDLQLRTDKPSG